MTPAQAITDEDTQGYSKSALDAACMTAFAKTHIGLVNSIAVIDALAAKGTVDKETIQALLNYTMILVDLNASAADAHYGPDFQDLPAGVHAGVGTVQ